MGRRNRKYKRGGRLEPESTQGSPPGSPSRQSSMDSTEAEKMGMETIYVDGVKHYYNPGEDDVYDTQGNLVDTLQNLKQQGRVITTENVRIVGGKKSKKSKKSKKTKKS